jgi:protein O-mannosyl-transferase
MAKKKNKQLAATVNVPAPSEKINRPETSTAANRLLTGRLSLGTHAAIAALIAAITWLCLKVCLDNQLTDWDDAGYIINNPIVRDVTAHGLRTIFKEPVMGNYHPLTILSYAIEYSYVELEPWLYHFDSLVLHIMVTMLVYCFVNLLSGKPVAAIIAALLFGLHPMHVESAAWVAGRKDLFCALFYFAACIAYICYLRATTNKKWGWYAAVLILFICSLLSKPVAVTLPLALLLIDYFEGRQWRLTLLFAKVPHFILSLLFGIISVKIQHGGGAMAAQKVPYNILERIALGGYALTTYLWKAVLPVNLRCFYAYPQKVDGALSVIYYLYPLAIAGLVFLVWKYARRNKAIVLGLSFFLINIALLLQFIPVGEAIVAERYSYIPYLGLFFVAGWLVATFMERAGKPAARGVAAIALVYIGGLGYLAHERCKVWYDSMSLWTDEVEKEPEHAPLAYNNLGFIYFNKRATATNLEEKAVYHDSAMYYMEKAVEIDPGFVNAQQGLGMLYYMKGNFEASAYHFRTALEKSPTAENYSDYANLLVQLGRNDSALMDYSTAISINPSLFVGYLNRGKLLKTLNRCGDAIMDFDKAININPSAGEAYYERAFCNRQAGNIPAAAQDLDKAITLGYHDIDTGLYHALKK